jgi:hypothetical protein
MSSGRSNEELTKTLEKLLKVDRGAINNLLLENLNNPK